MKKLLSVIIPNRNGAATIEQCLEAVFASRDDSFEVVVVDDCSDDDSAARIERFPCRLIRLPCHSGASKARNIGALHGKGEILFFTDADCLVQEETLATVRKTCEEQGRDAVIGGTYTELPYDKGFFSLFQSVLIHYSETKNAEYPDYIATHAMAVHARTFRQSGGFQEDGPPILEDVEFSHRIRRAGRRLFMDPRILVQHVFHYSFAGSLRNAVRKSKYWTMYSLRNRDLFADSGAASLELKCNVVAFGAAFLLAAVSLLTRDPFYFYTAAFPVAVNSMASRKLFLAFWNAKGFSFALAAFFYYATVYPLAVGAGAFAGLARTLLCECFFLRPAAFQAGNGKASALRKEGSGK